MLVQYSQAHDDDGSFVEATCDPDVIYLGPRYHMPGTLISYTCDLDMIYLGP